METLAGRNLEQTGGGFTLVELLLTVALIGLLLGAAVFSFSSLKRGAELDEGVTQMEGLLRFARSYAANSGKLTLLRFAPAMEGSTASLPIELMIENDPLGNPGFFDSVFEAEPYVRQIADLVKVIEVRRMDESELGRSGGTNDVLQAEFEEAMELPPALDPITFYPDGTSDSARLIVVSQNEDDLRRIQLAFSGVIGGIHRSYLTTDPADTEIAAAPRGTDETDY